MRRLPARLRGLAEILPATDAVADIGAGHGLLAAHLAAGGRAVIATERTPGALAELRDNLRHWGMEAAVDVRAGRGLEPIRDGEVGGAVIAGMGARTIVEIASAAPDHGLRWLALQAMQHAAELDAWLAERGWPVRQRVALRQSGRDYEALLVEVGT